LQPVLVLHVLCCGQGGQKGLFCVSGSAGLLGTVGNQCCVGVAIHQQPLLLECVVVFLQGSDVTRPLRLLEILQNDL
jgi:hypothetical protein